MAWFEGDPIASLSFLAQQEDLSGMMKDGLLVRENRNSISIRKGH